MKIIFSNFDDIKNPYYGGGGAYAIFEVAKRLVKFHEVTVITGKYPKSVDETIEGVKYKRIGLSWVTPKLAQIIFQLILPIYALKLNYDIWLESFTPPYSTAFLPLFSRKPIVGVTHMLAGRSMRRKYFIPFNVIENIGLKFYKNFIVLNESLKRQISSSNKNANIEIIPNGVDKKLIDLEFEKDGKYILFLGRIDIQQKGLDLLLNSYKLVAGDINLDLLIAGSGLDDDINWLNKRIAQLGLNNRVKCVGKVVGEQKDEIYRKAKIFVMPSRYEALPLTLFEAFCYKCPVVYFDIEVLNWIPSEIGIKVRRFDVKVFSQALLELSKDEEKTIRMGQSAKAYVQDCDWDGIAQKYKNTLEKVVNNAK